MPISIQAEVTDGGFPKDLLKKAEQIAPQFIQRTNRMLLTIENNVKFRIPRGQHCAGKGGTTKSAIKHQLTPTGGEVYADEGTAPWFKWFEEGRGEVKPKDAKVLHFCVKGKDIFVRHAGPSTGAYSMRKGARDSEQSIQRQANELGKWLERI